MTCTEFRSAGLHCSDLGQKQLVFFIKFEFLSYRDMNYLFGNLEKIESQRFEYCGRTLKYWGPKGWVPMENLGGGDFGILK
jgi:hypothetical protein